MNVIKISIARSDKPCSVLFRAKVFSTLGVISALPSGEAEPTLELDWILRRRLGKGSPMSLSPLTGER